MFKRMFGYKTLWVLLTFGASWGVTLWSWRNHHRLPTAEEMVSHFVLLPVALCLGYWGLHRTFEWLKRSPPGALSTEEGDAVQGNTAEQRIQLLIVDYNVLLPVGNTPQVVAEVLKGRDAPGFHPTLKNTGGLAQRAAWVDSLASEDFIDEQPSPGLSVDVRRALLLAAKALKPVLMHQLESRVAHSADHQGPLPVHFLVPARWGADIQAITRDWLMSELARVPMLGLDCQVSVHAVADARQVLGVVEQLRNGAALASEHPLQVVVASDSFGTEEAFSTTVHTTPGEGACALLLARSQPSAQDQVAATLHSFSAERREHSADLPGKVQSALLARLIQQNSPDPSAIGGVMTDADQRVSRQTEILAALHAALPHLDPRDECLHLPLCCGDMGAVTSLASLALAAAQSLDTQKDTLMVSIQDPFWRVICRIQAPVLPVQASLQDLT